MRHLRRHHRLLVRTQTQTGSATHQGSILPPPKLCGPGTTRPGLFFPEDRLHGSHDRPGGTPEHWIAKPTKKGGGVRYINPANPHDHVRVMPGDPNSPHPARQGPYVKRTKDGVAYDATGRAVGPRSAGGSHPAPGVQVQGMNA